MPADPLHAVLNRIRTAVLGREPVPEDLNRDAHRRLDRVVTEGAGTHLAELVTAFRQALEEYGGAPADGSGYRSAEGPRAGSKLLHASQALASALAGQGVALRILVVISEPDLRTWIGDTLDAEGFGVATAGRCDAALDVLRGPGAVDLLVTAIDLSDGDGLSLAIQCRRRSPGLPVLFVSSRPGHELGAFTNLLTTPFSPSDLKRRITGMLAAGS